eukprot:Skav204977  [mRNA]  locus=scaffold1180:205632:211759:- [translate_table: standard]
MEVYRHAALATAYCGMASWDAFSPQIDRILWRSAAAWAWCGRLESPGAMSLWALKSWAHGRGVILE